MLQTGWGSIPQLLQDAVDLQRFSQMLCALISNVVRIETANESQFEVSEGANACVFGGAEAAYSRDLRLLFFLRPSASAFAPSPPIMLRMRLRTSEQPKCQRVLTLVFGRGRGSVLEKGEGLILLQALCKLCCTLISNLV